jgi:hypothetical protein
MILEWIFPATLTLVYLEICRKMSIVRFASRKLTILSWSVRMNSHIGIEIPSFPGPSTTRIGEQL